MSAQKSKFCIASAAAAALVALAAACGGPKTVEPKPDYEPELRANKAKMMNKMDTTMNKKR